MANRFGDEETTKAGVSRFGDSEVIPGMEKLGGTPPSYPKPPQPALHNEMDAVYNPKYNTGFGVVSGLPVRGVNQAARGVEALADSSSYPDPSRARMGAAHDILSGASQAAAPFAVGAAVTAPIKTALALGSGWLGSKAASTGTQLAGGSPEAQNLAGDIGGLAAGGTVAGVAGPEARLLAGATGATKGAAQSFALPTGHMVIHHPFSAMGSMFSNPIAGSMVGRYIGGAFGPQGGEAGAVLGAGVPIARGMFRGAQTGLKAYDADLPTNWGNLLTGAEPRPTAAPPSLKWSNPGDYGSTISASLPPRSGATPPPIRSSPPGTYGSTIPAPETPQPSVNPPPIRTPAPGTFGSTIRTLPDRKATVPPPPLRGSSTKWMGSAVEGEPTPPPAVAPAPAQVATTPTSPSPAPATPQPTPTPAPATAAIAATPSPSTPAPPAKPQFEHAYPPPPEGSTPAQVKSHYQDAARTTKARALARYFRQSGVSSEDIQANRSNTDWWKQHASEARVNPPTSDESIEKVLSELRDMGKP